MLNCCLIKNASLQATDLNDARSLTCGTRSNVSYSEPSFKKFKMSLESYEEWFTVGRCELQ
jgi:hypothetical protein